MSSPPPFPFARALRLDPVSWRQGGYFISEPGSRKQANAFYPFTSIGLVPGHGAMWIAPFRPFSSHRGRHRRDRTSHIHDYLVVGFPLIRSGKTCGLRSGTGTTVYDAWTLAWACTGLRGAPLHLSTPSAVQSPCSRPHAPSLLRTHRFYWRPMEKRSLVTRSRSGKVEEDFFGGC